MSQEAQYPVTADKFAAFRLAQHHLSGGAGQGAYFSCRWQRSPGAAVLGRANLALVGSPRSAGSDIGGSQRTAAGQASCMRRLFLVPSEQLAIFTSSRTTGGKRSAGPWKGCAQTGCGGGDQARKRRSATATRPGDRRNCECARFFTITQAIQERSWEAAEESGGAVPDRMTDLAVMVHYACAADVC